MKLEKTKPQSKRGETAAPSASKRGAKAQYGAWESEFFFSYCMFRTLSMSISFCFSTFPTFFPCQLFPIFVRGAPQNHRFGYLGMTRLCNQSQSVICNRDSECFSFFLSVATMSQQRLRRSARIASTFYCPWTTWLLPQVLTVCDLHLLFPISSSSTAQTHHHLLFCASSFLKI